MPSRGCRAYGNESVHGTSKRTTCHVHGRIPRVHASSGATGATLGPASLRRRSQSAFRNAPARGRARGMRAGRSSQGRGAAGAGAPGERAHGVRRRRERRVRLQAQQRVATRVGRRRVKRGGYAWGDGC